ncbi:MAG: hypothetical protein HQL74_07230 [Magnetococcales bacterium]|nr:hypothetical protein [Magnetococcales bacterium]
MDLSPGDVILLFDQLTTPPKTKWFCCVCVAENWFLRINSLPRRHGQNQLIEHSKNFFLSHNSHIDLLGVIAVHPDQVLNAIANPFAYKGRLAMATMIELARNISASRTIPPRQKKMILAELSRVGIVTSD